MTLQETQKLANHICRLLKVSEINFPIGRTPKGNLGIVFNSNNEGFEMMLDSVPLSTKNSLQDENNIELKRMLEKYLFDTETVAFTMPEPVSHAKEEITITPVTPVKNKGGRPKKHAQEVKANT